MHMASLEATVACSVADIADRMTFSMHGYSLYHNHGRAPLDPGLTCVITARLTSALEGKAGDVEGSASTTNGRNGPVIGPTKWTWGRRVRTDHFARRDDDGGVCTPASCATCTGWARRAHSLVLYTTHPAVWDRQPCEFQAHESLSASARGAR